MTLALLLEAMINAHRQQTLSKRKPLFMEGFLQEKKVGSANKWWLLCQLCSGKFRQFVESFVLFN